MERCLILGMKTGVIKKQNKKTKQKLGMSMGPEMMGKKPQLDEKPTQRTPPAPSGERVLHQRRINSPRLKRPSQSSTPEEVNTLESVQQHTSFEAGTITDFVETWRPLTSDEFMLGTATGSEIPISGFQSSGLGKSHKTMFKKKSVHRNGQRNSKTARSGRD